MRLLRQALTAATFLSALLARPGGAQPGPATGTVAGHVTDRASGRPIVDVNVLIVGTTRGVRTDAEGAYRIAAIPAGPVQVRVQRVGFGSETRRVTVVAGQVVTQDFVLNAVATTLQDVVATVTGPQRRVELGNTVPTIDVVSVVRDAAPVNLGTVLAARTANVEVQQGASTGAGTRIRIRGASSLSLNNEPVYVVDGIRVESGSSSTSIGVGGTTPSRIDDIVPSEIENIEIIKGPSAAALYGTNAANGVVSITTKHGQYGRTQWNAFAEQGRVEDVTAYPDAYYYFGHSASSGAAQQCFLTTIAAGTCVADSLSRFNPLLNPLTRPFANGPRRQYGLQVSGGGSGVRYFVSGTSEAEDGVDRMPAYEVTRLQAERGTGVPTEEQTPNALRRTSIRANLGASPNDKTDIVVSSAVILSDLRLPQSDNNSIGLFSNALGGPGRSDLKSALGVPLYGFRQLPPGDIFSHTFKQSVNRVLGSTQANYRPFGWLATHGTVGLDFTDRRDLDYQPLGYGPHVFGLDQGTITDNRTELYEYTADGGATGTWAVTSGITARTSAGVQYYHHVYDRNGASASQLGPGAPRVTSGAVKSADQQYDADKTMGVYVEEALDLGERLFLTAGVRQDRNSAFGVDFGAVRYPKASASWLLSKESFFPRTTFLPEVRLRAAYGQSGVQPGTRDALAYFNAEDAVLGGTPVPALTVGAIGNAGLRPERSTETEFGTDLGFLGNRVSLELTHYNKRTRDALISRLLAPSLGGPAVQLANLGAVRNSGNEVVLRASAVDRRAVAVDLMLAYSHNENRLLSLGGVPPIIGSTIQERAGYPLFSYWQRPFTYSDANHNGIIEASEVHIADSAVYVGPSQPTHELSFNPTVDLFNRWVHLSATFDHKGGNHLLNGTERIRCQSRNNCEAISDPHASLADQARAVAVRVANGTQYGYMEDATFTKLRDASVTVSLPSAWVSRVNASAASVTFSGRNLHTWTRYSGLDPENNYGQADIPSDFQTLPSPRYYLVRFNLGF